MHKVGYNFAMESQSMVLYYILVPSPLCLYMSNLYVIHVLLFPPDPSDHPLAHNVTLIYQLVTKHDWTLYAHLKDITGQLNHILVK